VGYTKFISLSPQKEIVLFTDNLGTHGKKESVAEALSNGLCQLYIPPNCSHWTQPLQSTPNIQLDFSLISMIDGLIGITKFLLQ